MATRSDYLFPTRVMAALARGKLTQSLRAALRAGELGSETVAVEAAIRTAFRHRWVVHVEPPAGRPATTVAKYLARYVQGPAIGDARMVAVTDTEVSFHTRRGVLTVPGPEFVRRFALHILPRRFRRVRYAGLYASGSAAIRWTRARAVLHAPEPPPRPPRPVRGCPACGGPVAETSLPGLPRCRPWRLPRARGPP